MPATLNESIVDAAVPVLERSYVFTDEARDFIVNPDDMGEIGPRKLRGWV